jgi:hypothetical protein
MTVCYQLTMAKSRTPQTRELPPTQGRDLVHLGHGLRHIPAIVVIGVTHTIFSRIAEVRGGSFAFGDNDSEVDTIMSPLTTGKHIGVQNAGYPRVGGGREGYIPLPSICV